MKKPGENKVEVNSKKTQKNSFSVLFSESLLYTAQ